MPRQAARKAASAATKETQLHVAPLEPIGVYKWPFNTADVHALCDQNWGERSQATVIAARAHLTNLVLIELLVQSPALDLGSLTQDPPSKRTENSQVPYDESFWSVDGSTYLTHGDAPAALPFRVVFFLHEFDPSKPLYTSDGIKIDLPERTQLPARLSKVIDHYDSP